MTNTPATFKQDALRRIIVMASDKKMAAVHDPLARIAAVAEAALT